MKCNKTAKVITTTRCVLNAEDIIKKFNFPKDAEVFVSVPGGGDWSNTTLMIGRDSDIVVTYTTAENRET